MNLLNETKEILHDNGKTFSDVIWCGNVNGSMTVKEFRKLANIEYNDECGTQEISNSLVVVGKNWWLERGEYDGKEWWEFKQLPKKPKYRFDRGTLRIK
jgi:hypothetical protein